MLCSTGVFCLTLLPRWFREGLVTEYDIWTHQKIRRTMCSPCSSNSLVKHHLMRCSARVQRGASMHQQGPLFTFSNFPSHLGC